ncbi:hypothetical protein BV25DRAFT_1823394 [Artomyces pyxidatus]|uniref:Uncharacterized protein n=1 Tax=Artomyces pyxidatus TaxID=48021 RepID=A0ACB8T6M4_9AGAM|nr:hypothetical protein BV25DRAFT_1823394 [Artomyces pyxidatus]
MSELAKDKKQDTLFGPNIGIVSSGPKWADSDDEKRRSSVDELTPEIVKGWVAKSKETIQPTTTLQALVNLKRPTLRLSPLELHPSDDPDHVDSHHHHALEFEFDCDAPKAGVYVHVILNPEQLQAGTSSSRVLVYEHILDGGFGRVLKLDDGATIELGRFEHREPLANPSASDVKLDKSAASTPEIPDLASQGAASPTEARQERKRLFTGLHFRKRTQNRVSGPALAVMDADAAGPAATEEEKAKDEKDDQSEDTGVKVVIRLVALDEDGKELPSINEQSTYLHVVRFGPPPAEGEDTRPWVVKVVKREATIGMHTFHLHEIYGLSSAPTHTPAAAAPVPAPVSPTTHSYPPVPAPAAPQHEDEPSSECLVCLSSPREVVLLPCRHLVACKECAVNMVEFGAGGAIHNADDGTTAAEPPTTASPPLVDTPAEAAEEAQAPASPVNADEEAAPVPAADADAPAADAEPAAEGMPEPAAPVVTPIAPVPTNPRRKRRAKGWFCPVCRQRKYHTFLSVKCATHSAYSLYIVAAHHHHPTYSRA